MENKNIVKEENKVVKEELLEGQKRYPAVYLSSEHLEGTTKEGKRYNIGKVSFQLVLEQTNKETGEITVKKSIVETVCDPASLPGEDFEEFARCFAVYELPADPSYEKARPRFVKLIK